MSDPIETASAAAMPGSTSLMDASRALESLVGAAPAPLGFQPMGAELAPRAAALAARLPPGVDPAEVPQTLAELGELVSRAYDLSVTAAASLNIPVAGSVSGGLNRRVVIFEWARFKNVSGAGEIVYQFGYAIRFCLTVNKWDAETKLSLPFLAAQAEVGRIEASWIMQVRGLSGPEIDRAVLPPQELDVETFVIAKQSLQDVITAVSHPTTRFIPGTILATLDPTAPEVELWLAAVKAFAVADLQRGKTRDECQSRAPVGDPAVFDVISDVYVRLGVPDGATRPTRAQRDRARALLHGLTVEAD